MRSACATSTSLATCTSPSGTGCSGSSGTCRSTAAGQSRISCRTVGCSAGFARAPPAPRDRLQRLFRALPQHGRGPEPDLLSDRRMLGGLGRVALGPHHIVQRGGEVGVCEPIGHDSVDDAPRVPSPEPLAPHYRPDPDARLVRGPEVELMWGRWLLLGGDDAADRESRVGPLDHEAVLGTREPGYGMRDARCGMRSDGARALRYVSTSWIG